MSGHSKWATIKRKKGAIDAKRGAQFTKCAKEITVAAREGGGSSDLNARLRSAVLAAKAINMPSANIDRAIKRGTGEIEGATYEELAYEGYGPGGVAVLIECLTDNRNRTFPEIRKIFEKCGGTIGAAGSVAFLFEKKGEIVIDRAAVSEEKLMEVALEAGAEDIQESGDTWEVTTPPAAYLPVAKAIQEASIPTLSSELAMVPTTTARVEGKVADQVLRLIDGLEEHDDVQHVWSNFDMDEKTLAAHES